MHCLRKILTVLLALSPIFSLGGQNLAVRNTTTYGQQAETNDKGLFEKSRNVIKATSFTKHRQNPPKSSQNYEQRMDSLIIQNWSDVSSQWEKTLKESYTYNAAGNIILFNKSSRTTSNQWNIYWKEEYTYNTAGKMSQLVLMVLDSTTNQLGNFWKEEYTYNAAGDITLYWVYSWNTSTNTWINTWKAEYTYDANGHLSLYQDYYWSSNAWINSWKAEYNYTASGYLTLYQDYYYNTSNGQWIKSWKAEYTYNTANLIILYQEYAWNTSSNLWVNSAKKDFLYIAAGLLSSVSEYVWINNQWRYSEKEEFSYNSLGKEVLHQLSLSNQAGNQWVNAWKAETSYDANGSLDLVIESNWILSPGQWVYSTKWDYNFNPAFQHPDIMMPFWFASDELFYTAMLEQFTEYVYANNAWLAVSKDEFYYTFIGSTGIGQESVRDFSLYPNPAKDFITIHSPSPMVEFLLFDLSGRLISSILTQAGDPISISHLKAGMYVYTIRNKDIEVTGKLIIK